MPDPNLTDAFSRLKELADNIERDGAEMSLDDLDAILKEAAPLKELALSRIAATRVLAEKLGKQ